MSYQITVKQLDSPYVGSRFEVNFTERTYEEVQKTINTLAKEDSKDYLLKYLKDTRHNSK